MSLLDFSHVSYTDNGETILKPFSLTIDPGDFISVVGPSGSGKSTFFRLCCHLISPTGGTIAFHGQALSDLEPTVLRQQIAYCPQTPLLFGEKVSENIEFPYMLRNRSVDHTRVRELFASFHLSEDYLEKDVKKLSGGEKQRIALIRALLFMPEILLIDEATSALDAGNTERVERLVADMNRTGTTVLWITHDPGQNRKYANKVLSIENGAMRVPEVIR